jgi:hypothetical protein
MRATTTSEDDDFLEKMDLVPKTLLERAAEYVAGNFPPEDVYEEQQLRDWTKSFSMWQPSSPLGAMIRPPKSAVLSPIATTTNCRAATMVFPAASPTTSVYLTVRLK